MSNIKNANVQKKKLSGISGWLYLPLLVLLIQPLYFIKVLWGFLQASNPFQFSINIYILIYDILLILTTLHLIYLFLKKKSITPIYFLFNKMLFFILWTFIAVYSVNIHLTAESNLNIFQVFFANIIGLIIFIPYFTFSRRAKNTFSQDLVQNIALDRIIVFLVPFLDKLQIFFYKIRKYFFLLIPAFIGLVVFLAMVILVLISYL